MAFPRIEVTLNAFSCRVAALCLACITGSFTDAEDKAPHDADMGNGEKNWIVTDGVRRGGNVLTFDEVGIDGNGWLIIHPVHNGVPDGDQYLAATYLEDGVTRNVSIKVYRGLATEEQLLVMLHRDVNENRSFDFIFVDNGNVVDSAVFEGTKLIGHIIRAP